MEKLNQADASAPQVEPTKSNNYQNLDDFIQEASIALTNASDPDILPLLNRRGYTLDIINSKLNEITVLKELVAKQTKEYGEQYEATKDYAAGVALLHTDYIDNLIIARVVFKDNVAAKTTLGLKGSRKRAESSYCHQAELFYSGILNNPSYKLAVAERGITEEELITGKEGYEKLTLLAAKKTKETGEAQQATANRDIAIDSFNEWYSNFKKIAKVALSKTPQLTKKLGWKEL